MPIRTSEIILSIYSRYHTAGVCARECVCFKRHGEERVNIIRRAREMLGNKDRFNSASVGCHAAINKKNIDIQSSVCMLESSVIFPFKDTPSDREESLIGHNNFQKRTFFPRWYPEEQMESRFLELRSTDTEAK